MTRTLTPEMKEFLKNNVVGISSKELTAKFNKEFGVDFKVKQITDFKTYYGLKNGLGPIFPKEVKEFVAKHVKGLLREELTELVNKTFNTNYTPRQIMHLKQTYRWTAGAGIHKRCNIKYGKMPTYIGQIRVYGGYTLIKVGEPKKWVRLATYVWEQHYGKVPKDCVITYLDGNKQNNNIENLVCLKRAENTVMNCQGLKTSNAELTKLGIAATKLKMAKTYRKCLRHKRRIKQRITQGK